MEQQKQENDIAEAPGKPTKALFSLKNREKENIHSILLKMCTALAEITYRKSQKETRKL